MHTYILHTYIHTYIASYTHMYIAIYIYSYIVQHSYASIVIHLVPICQFSSHDIMMNDAKGNKTTINIIAILGPTYLYGNEPFDFHVLLPVCLYIVNLQPILSYNVISIIIIKASTYIIMYVCNTLSQLKLSFECATPNDDVMYLIP